MDNRDLPTLYYDRITELLNEAASTYMTPLQIVANRTELSSNIYYYLKEQGSKQFSIEEIRTKLNELKSPELNKIVKRMLDE